MSNNDIAGGQQAAPPGEAKDHKKMKAEGCQGRRDPKEEDRKRHRKLNDKRVYQLSIARYLLLFKRLT